MAGRGDADEILVLVRCHLVRGLEGYGWENHPGRDFAEAWHIPKARRSGWRPKRGQTGNKVLGREA